MIPLGLRQNNPGNIRPSKSYRWVGEVGEGSGFVIFDTMENGIRALCKNLIAYQDRYGIKTVRATIERWAPPQDHNDTEAYIQMVCSILDCDDDQDYFDFRDPNFLFWMCVAIGEQENGHGPFNQYVSDRDIENGVALALNS